MIDSTKFKRYQGTLIKRPYANTPSKASSGMLPLGKENDFEVFANFASSGYPILLGIDEHYQLLSELVAHANEHLNKPTILLRISMPGGMRLPANLLADNVLLAEAIENEEQKLVSQNIELLVIEDRFSRIKVDNNDNTIKLRLYGENQTNNSALAPLIDHLHAHGVLEGNAK